MDTPQSEAATAPIVPDRPDLDQFASYEEGDALVVCDRTEPAAWLRSEHTVPIER